MPFEARRIFTVNEVPRRKRPRGLRHKQCHQFLWCVAGSLRRLVDDCTRRAEVLPSGDGMGLYMPPLTWGTQYRYEAETVLNVAASRPYEAADYICTYEEFLRERDTADRRDGTP